MSNTNSPGSPFKEEAGTKTPDSEKVVTVKVVTPVFLDGQQYVKDITTKVSLKQWRALSRHLEWVDGPKEHDPANKTFAEKAAKRLDAREQALAKAAALAVLFFMLLFTPAAKAGPGTFSPLPIPPMIVLLPTNGLVTATNGIVGTGTNMNQVSNTCVGLSTAQTNVFVPQTNSFGQITNLISVEKFDEIWLVLKGQQGTAVGGSGFTNIWEFWQTDGTITGLDSNHPIFSLTFNVPSTCTNGCLITNISRNLLGSTGLIVPGRIYDATGTNACTNLSLTAYVKPIRSGN